MNINRSFLKKYATVALLTIAAIVFLPEVLFAKGAIIGYVWGNRNVSELNLISE